MPDAVSGVISRARGQRAEGRRILGVGGGEKPARSLAAGISGAGTGWYVLLTLSVYAALDEATAYVITTLGPEISNTLGTSPATYAMLASQRQTFVGLTALQFAWIFHKRQHRALLTNNFGFQYGPALAIGSVITWTPGMAGVIGGAGTGAAVVHAAHRPTIMDAYPPGTRLRALSFHRGAAVAGAIAGPLLVALLSGPVGLTWRGTLLVTGLIFVPLSLIGLRLRDPARGRFDSDRIAALMSPDRPDGPIRTGDPTELTFLEALRRVWLIPTLRRLLAVWAVLGIAVHPLTVHQSFWLKEQFDLTTSQRGFFFAGCWCLAPFVLWAASRKGEGIWRQDPARLARLTSWVLVVLAGGLVLAVVPVLGVSLAGFSVVFAAEAVAVAALSLIVMTVVRPRNRPIAAALAAVYYGLVGGQGGSILMSGIESRYSAATAIVVLTVPALGAALLLRKSAAHLDEDLDRVVDEILEDEGIHALADAAAPAPAPDEGDSGSATDPAPAPAPDGGDSGSATEPAPAPAPDEHGTGSGSATEPAPARTAAALPLLACRGVDFFYGQLQVLHDVDFTVRDGEMLALLGVNGAGKSSLLKVVSGIGLPSAGSVRLDGRDITYLDAERRVGLGITQIPGGRAVFGPISVAENLRGFGHALGRHRRRQLDTAIDACFERFPVLAERRNAPAATLSGGEQQMLALSKAFILGPRLLLIDELSLGLAPIVVDQLLGMVREINAAGTAVVLVEQSISIALSVVDHAYFMEKGQMRFDGPSGDLLGRDDLLRAVFLGADDRTGSHV